MRSRVLAAALMTIVLASAMLVLGASTRSASEIVAAEIARLDGVLTNAEKSVPENAKGQIAPLREALARAKRAHDPAYALYRLRDAFIGIEGLSYLAAHAEASKSLPAFEKLWNEERAKRTAKSSKPGGTLLQRALIESAATRSERLFDASLPYAKADAPWSGLYYLGESEANRRYGDFVRSMAAESGVNERGPKSRDVAAAVDTLERETLKIFGNDVTNQKLIGVSVRIKEARELLAAGRVDGAALLAVEGRVALMRRGGVAASHVQPKIAAAKSIEDLLMAWSGDEEPPMAEAIRADVVPYFRSLYAAAPVAAQAPAEVKVTLVRWPYT